MDAAQLIENVRFALGLVDEQATLIDDTEIERYLGMYPTDWRLAAAALAEVLAVRALNRPTTFGLSGVMNVSWADRAKTWLAVAKALRQQVADDDAAQAAIGTVSAIQLERIGIEIGEPEYSRERRDRTRGLW